MNRLNTPRFALFMILIAFGTGCRFSYSGTSTADEESVTSSRSRLDANEEDDAESTLTTERDTPSLEASSE
jgi:hypothetical protein